MGFRSSLLPLAAAGALAVSGAAAEEWIVSPKLTESSRAASPGEDLGRGGLLGDSLYSGFTYRGLLDEDTGDPGWTLEEGADSPYDVDPRQNLYLPRPETRIVFDLL